MLCHLRLLAPGAPLGPLRGRFCRWNPGRSEPEFPRPCTDMGASPETLRKEGHAACNAGHIRMASPRAGEAGAGPRVPAPRSLGPRRWQPRLCQRGSRLQGAEG